MSQNNQQVSLPDHVVLQLSAQDAMTILGALHDAGPYKTVFPIVRNIEQQLVAQANKATAQYSGPTPGAPEPIAPPADNDHVAPGCEQFAASPAEAPVAHHSV
jgi:hypothetical protein